MRPLHEQLAAEFIGTFVFVFIAAGAATMAALTGAGTLPVAVATGLILAIMISAMGHISGGHFNPAVTVGAWVTGKIDTVRAPLYIVVQLAGAAAGAGLLRLCLSKKIWGPGNLGATLINPQAKAFGFSTPKALLLEAVMTFALVLVVFATAIDERGTFKAIAGFGIGLVVTADALLGGSLTGASMNPARSFGPALVIWKWTDFLGPTSSDRWPAPSSPPRSTGSSSFGRRRATMPSRSRTRAPSSIPRPKGRPRWRPGRRSREWTSSARKNRPPRPYRGAMAPSGEDRTTPVYLDGAAAMPPLPEAEQAVADALRRFADPGAAHTPGRAARATLEHVRAAIADAIGADPDEVILTTSGTAANALAILGLIAGGPGQIVVSSLEHSSVTEPARASGLEVVEVPCDEEGSIDMDRFAALVAQPGTRMASVQHASPDVGTMQSVAECARVARAAGVLFHTDACQSLAHLPLDARALGAEEPVDHLVAQGVRARRGRRAVRAAGALSPDTLLRGRDRQDYRAPTLGLPALAGMAAALTVMRPRVADLAGRLWALSQRLRDGLEGCGRVLGHPTWRVPHIVAVAVAGVDRETLFMTLEDREPGG